MGAETPSFKTPGQLVVVATHVSLHMGALARDVTRDTGKGMLLLWARKPRQREGWSSLGRGRSQFRPN